MTATQSEIDRVRRMVDEPTVDTYVDDDIQAAIERYPTIDDLGTDPYEVDYSTTPPTRSIRDDWIPTYDLHAAAAEIWEEKAALLAEDYDFKADGASYERSQAHEQAKKQARYHLSRRKAGTVKLHPQPQLLPNDDLTN